MSTIKVNAIQTVNGTGNITLSNPVSATTTNTTVATLLNSGSHNTANGVLHVKQSTATNNPTMVIEQTGGVVIQVILKDCILKLLVRIKGTGKAIRVTTTNSNLNSGTAFDAFSVYNGGNDAFGNLAFTTGGKGIDFSSAPTFNSGVTSSILDDYEDNPWTPSVGGTTPTYQSQSGVYTKVGRMVLIWFDLFIIP